jgi:hypothetical protein
MSEKIHKPGEKVPVSGIYDIVDKSGEPTGHQRTDVKDKVFPPDPRGDGFKLNTPTQT